MPTATAYELIFADVSRRTGLYARQVKNDTLAVLEDDTEVIQQFFDSAVTRVLTAVGILSTTREDFDGTEETDPETEEEQQAENDPSLLPVELYDAVTFYIMFEWFRSNGAIDMGEYYRKEFENQLSIYRFAPNTPSTASRTYRAI